MNGVVNMKDAVILSGPMQETREIMTQHLSFAKWKESAFSTEQLKGVRWLLGARPKGLPDALVEPLTVTPMAQSVLMQLHVKKFLQDSRRVKASAKKLVRASQEDFDKLADYACIFAHLRQAAKAATSDSKVDEKLMNAFMARSLGIKSISIFNLGVNVFQSMVCIKSNHWEISYQQAWLPGHCKFKRYLLWCQQHQGFWLSPSSKGLLQ